jgi:hypothetical protein
VLRVNARRTAHRLLALLSLCTVVLLVASRLACSSSTRQPSQVATPAPRQVALDSALPVVVEAVGIPVRASRTWASALAPNARGGWNFITQSFELYTESPAEFIVVDLERGTSTIQEGTPKRFTNANFKVGSELRAPNGRVFFPGVDNTVAYYDPKDETVKELGSLLPIAEDKLFHQAVIAPDGKLYLGTQSSKLPTIVQLDPVTLDARVLGQVGRQRNGYSYAYEMVVDSSWVYVTVGQSPWELVALHIPTGTSKVLATRDERGFMKLEDRANGVVATLITNLRTKSERREELWLAGGTGRPTPSPRAARRTAGRGVEPPPPEVDLSAANPDANGIGRIAWRPRGSSEPFRKVQFKVQHVAPVKLESLVALPDGTLLGNAKQYHGFFRYRAERGFEFHGAHGPSGGPRAVLNGHVYIAGYPKGVLYRFDPAQPWTSTLADEMNALRDLPPSDVNPRRLGNFRETGTHYASFLVADGDMLFYAGRRERDGEGAGVGSYDPTRGLFAGHFRGLTTLDPSGLAVLGEDVVFAGKSRVRGREAQLVIYNRALEERARVVPRAGLSSAGTIFPTPEPGVIVGIVAEDKIAYRYDVRARKLLGWVSLDGQPEASARRADGTIWLVLDRTLVRIDPRTLALTPFGDVGSIPENAEHLTWQGDDLYMTVGPELRRAARVGLPTRP